MNTYQYNNYDEYKNFNKNDLYYDIDDYDINYYPQEPDIDLWSSFLNRELTEDEQKIIINVIVEDDLNNQIKSLHTNLKLNGSYYIPQLTNNVGNCLFESLMILELGNSDVIRKNIAALLLLVRNDRSFFPNLNLSPEEIFNNVNYVTEVYCVEDDKYYKYNYDMMIIDLYSNYSWSRLPTELILLAISKVYSVKINIHHNRHKFINTVNAWNNKLNIKNINLGLINEEHYLPIIELSNDIIHEAFGDIFNYPEIYNELNNIPFYDQERKKFHKWAKNIVSNIQVSTNVNTNINTSINTNENKKESSNNKINSKIELELNKILRKDLDEIDNIAEFEIIK